MALAKSLNVNGTVYEVEALSSAARVQVENIEAANTEIARLQRQLALAQTAKNVYIAALSSALASNESAETKSAKQTDSKKSRKTQTKI